MEVGKRSEAQSDAAKTNPSKSILHDIYSDPALEQTLAEDPLFKFLTQWWRQIAVVVGAVCVIYYATNVFQETRIAEMKHSADMFIKAQREFDAYQGVRQQIIDLKQKLSNPSPDAKNATQEKEMADNKKKLEELTKTSVEAKGKLEDLLVTLADSNDPYVSLARLYRGQLAVLDGNLVEARKYLQHRPLSPSSKKEEVLDLYREMENLALARALLDQDDSYLEGRNILKELVSLGQYVNASAALTLSKISTTPDERKEALIAMEQLLERTPENAAVLENEIARLKSSLQ